MFKGNNTKFVKTKREVRRKQFKPERNALLLKVQLKKQQQ